MIIDWTYLNLWTDGRYKVELRCHADDGSVVAQAKPYTLEPKKRNGFTVPKATTGIAIWVTPEKDNEGLTGVQPIGWSLEIKAK
jgi:hypothetical protein